MNVGLLLPLPAHSHASLESHWPERRPGPDARALGLIGLAFVLAVAIDYLAPWPYVMTPLYAIPVLVAARRLSPRATLLTAALATAINVASGIVQETPLVVHLLYTLGLVLTDYLAVVVAQQRREVARHASEAEEATRHLREFLDYVVHELRNALAAVHGYVQLLQRRTAAADSGGERRGLEAIDHAAERIRRLVDDLQDVAHLKTARFQLHPTTMDLVTAIREVVMLRQRATTIHRLTVDAPARLEGTWDRERIDQILANLVSNAVKYSPAGGEVRIPVACESDEAVVSVADQGLGMDAEQQARLFQPFARLHRRQDVEGTGLGLYITRGLVEAHGGRIWVESAPGQGSRFSVALPLRAPDRGDQAEGDRANARGGS